MGEVLVRQKENCPLVITVQYWLHTGLATESGSHVRRVLWFLFCLLLMN